MGPAVAIIFVVIFTIAIIAWAVSYSQKQRDKLARIFTEAAERAGGRFAPGVSGFFKHASPTITVNRDGTTISADTYIVSSGDSSTTYSRVSAPYSLGGGPDLHIRRQGALHSIGKALGMQDLQIGEPAFDQAFMIKAPSVATVLRLFPSDERLALLHQLPRWWIRGKDGSVVLERVGYPDNAGEVATAIGLVAAVASADKRLMDTVAAHPDARIEGPEVVFAGTVEGRFAIGELGAKLRVPNQQQGPEIALDCAAADAAALLPEGSLEPTLAAQVQAIGQARLARDGQHAWVTWRETPSAENIEAAWRVLTALAAPSTRVGAFR